MGWLHSHAVATPSAGRTPSNSGRWRLGSRRRALAATHPWLRAKANCISQSPPAERVAARWLFGGEASSSPRQRPAMIGVDAGRDAGGLGIRGVASWGFERRDTAEDDEWVRSRRVSRSGRRVAGRQWESGFPNARDARPSVGGGGGGFGRIVCRASSTGNRGEHHSTVVC